jgi:transcriptional regulator with XRE-family HTH domain
MGDIGSKVVALRSKIGMSQKDLADATSIPQATVSRIERGIIRQPRLEVLRKLAEGLHVTVDYLADRTEAMSGNDVVGADPRANAIFRGYQDMSEEEKAELMTFVRFLQSKKAPKGRHGGDKG